MQRHSHKENSGLVRFSIAVNMTRRRPDVPMERRG